MFLTIQILLRTFEKRLSSFHTFDQAVQSNGEKGREYGTRVEGAKVHKTV